MHGSPRLFLYYTMNFEAYGAAESVHHTALGSMPTSAQVRRDR